MGADMSCVVCGARAYLALSPTGTREDFDLMKLDREGHPADSWITAEQIPANKDSAPSEAAS
jgi:hypothetical protein